MTLSQVQISFQPFLHCGVLLCAIRECMDESLAPSAPPDGILWINGSMLVASLLLALLHLYQCLSAHCVCHVKMEQTNLILLWSMHMHIPIFTAALSANSTSRTETTWMTLFIHLRSICFKMTHQVMFRNSTGQCMTKTVSFLCNAIIKIIYQNLCKKLRFNVKLVNQGRMQTHF